MIGIISIIYRVAFYRLPSQLMPVYFSSIASGSNGNCYYVGTNTEAVLVDVGISCREVEKRMKVLGLKMDSVKAIFISHEHSDHIRGLCALAQKYQLPIYGSFHTLNACRDIHHLQKMHFAANDTIHIGALSVKAFNKYHDAVDPFSFTISAGGFTVGVFTDIGQLCQNLAYHFSLCQAVFLEANYDDAMLDAGRYPYFLKKRIRGGNGHLSNVQALDVFVRHRSPQLQYVLLAHLSKDNNCPELALRLFKEYAEEVQIAVASRYEPSLLYVLSADAKVAMPKPQIALSAQLSLF